jgi:hypothetical protein
LHGEKKENGEIHPARRRELHMKTRERAAPESPPEIRAARCEGGGSAGQRAARVTVSTIAISVSR